MFDLELCESLGLLDVTDCIHNTFQKAFKGIIGIPILAFIETAKE